MNLISREMIVKLSYYLASAIQQIEIHMDAASTTIKIFQKKIRSLCGL